MSRVPSTAQTASGTIAIIANWVMLMMLSRSPMNQTAPASDDAEKRRQEWSWLDRCECFALAP